VCTYTHVYTYKHIHTQANVTLPLACTFNTSLHSVVCAQAGIYIYIYIGIYTYI